MCNMVEFDDFHHCYVSMFFMVFASSFFLLLSAYNSCFDTVTAIEIKKLKLHKM